MAAQPATHAWFAPSPVDTGLAESDDLLKRPGEFERLWRGFMTARVTLGLVLVALQGSLYALGQSTHTGLIFVCGGYFAATLAVRMFAQPRRLGPTFDPQWVFTIGVDVLVFTVLQFLQGSSINYAPLLALPVLLAAVLGTLWLAVGTAAGVSLLLLGYSGWLSTQGGGDSAAHFAQSALTGAGCFVIAFLSNQLSTRLVLEEQRTKRSQLAVRLQRQVNALVIETLTDGILVVDGQGIVRAANPAARHMLGTEQSRRVASFGLGSESAWSALADLARLSFTRTEMRHTDLVVHHPGQGLRRLRVRTRQTGAQGAQRPGEESLCVMFLQDQREMEARMRTEKLASMGRMSAAVAHEIRNPLAAIVQANALLDEDMDDPKHRQLTQMVAQNAQRLGRIVDEVLDISRVQAQDSAATAQTLPLSESVERIWQDWSQQTSSQHLASLARMSPDMQVAFDPDHLRRLLVNLLDNALRYASGESGAIKISVARNEDGQAVMAVWSDGAPLEPSVEQHLFEPFFSSESRSSGLGLYISRELCEGHGASIVYQRSQRTVGTREAGGNEFFVAFRTARAGDRIKARQIAAA